MAEEIVVDGDGDGDSGGIGGDLLLGTRDKPRIYDSGRDKNDSLFVQLERGAAGDRVALGTGSIVS